MIAEKLGGGGTRGDVEGRAKTRGNAEDQGNLEETKENWEKSDQGILTIKLS